MKHNPIGCPANIEFLLHCHVKYDSVFERHTSPHHVELIADWLEAGVIKRHEIFGATPCTPISYRTTLLGKAWVEALGRVPMPRCAYIDQDGTVLIEDKK